MSHKRYELAIAGDREVIRSAVGYWTRHFKNDEVGATVIPTAGFWQGEEEVGAIVRFDWPNFTAWQGQGKYLWEQLLITLATMLPEERFGHQTVTEVEFTEVDFATLR